MSRCILVIERPRSCSTWIDRLFNSHPRMLYRHRPESLRWPVLPLYPESTESPGQLAVCLEALPEAIA